MFFRTFSKLRRDELGATLVEYGVAIVLAIVVGTAGLLGLAGSIEGNLDRASNEMTPDQP